MGKKPTVSVTYENERISIKNSLPYLKCVLRLSCVVHEPNYGRFKLFLLKSFHSVLENAMSLAGKLKILNMTFWVYVSVEQVQAITFSHLFKISCFSY